MDERADGSVSSVRYSRLETDGGSTSHGRLEHQDSGVLSAIFKEVDEANLTGECRHERGKVVTSESLDRPVPTQQTRRRRTNMSDRLRAIDIHQINPARHFDYWKDKSSTMYKLIRQLRTMEVEEDMAQTNEELGARLLQAQVPFWVRAIPSPIYSYSRLRVAAYLTSATLITDVPRITQPVEISSVCHMVRLGRSDHRVLIAALREGLREVAGLGCCRSVRGAGGLLPNLSSHYGHYLWKRRLVVAIAE